MKEVLIMNGYNRMNEFVEKVIAIKEAESSVFTGVSISSLDCDITDEYAMLAYLGRNKSNISKFHLIAGYFNDDSLRYTTLLHGKELTFGEFHCNKKGYIGRERILAGTQFKRALDRPVKGYQYAKVEMSQEFLDMVDYLLALHKHNMTWRGVQFSIFHSTQAQQAVGNQKILKQL